MQGKLRFNIALNMALRLSASSTKEGIGINILRTMYGIFGSIVAQAIFLRKSRLIASKFTMHIPGRDTPPQYSLPLPRNPGIVVWHHARVCTCVEESLVLVCQRDVDDDWGGKCHKSLAERGSKKPGIGSCEVLKC